MKVSAQLRWRFNYAPSASAVTDDRAGGMNHRMDRCRDLLLLRCEGMWQRVRGMGGVALVVPFLKPL